MGDELMAMGEAWKTSAEFGGAPVVITDRHGKPRWSDIWTGAPYIRQVGDNREGISIRNGPGCRPYVANVTSDRWTWRDYAPIPAELEHIVGDVIRGTGGYVVIEPRLKGSASQNKRWPDHHWSRLIGLFRERFPGVRLVTLGPAPWSSVVDHILTPGFRDAARALRQAALYVGHEGGLHHLSAAVGIPAVVLFGGYVPPSATGYPWHRNITGGATACGMRTFCAHCAQTMESITPAAVLGEVDALSIF